MIAFSSVRDRGIATPVYFSSGMRLSELISLDVDQLSPLIRQRKDAERTYEIPIIGKGKRPRTVFVSPRATR